MNINYEADKAIKEATLVSKSAKEKRRKKLSINIPIGEM